MPRRGTVYAAKLIVFGTVTLIVSVITSFVSFFARSFRSPPARRPCRAPG
jgi:hypothetical protein